MTHLVDIVNLAKAALYLLYGVAVLWLAHATIVEQSAPVSTARLDANHRIAAGDLSTSASAALIGRYLREAVGPDSPITPAMVSDGPIVPVVPTGIQIVVNMERSALMPGDIAVGHSVSVQKDGRVLLDQGKVVALPCDESRCAVVIALAKAPGFDALTLVGATVAAVPEATRP